MKRVVQIAVALVLGVSSSGDATDKADGTVAARPATFLLPDFAAVSGIDRAASAAEYEEARNDRRFVLERFTYASDGLEVSAYLYRPDQAAGPLPLVVFNRGSYVVKDQAPGLLATFRRIAIEGFVVLAPMLRGSDGMEGRDEMGGADLHDIANAIVGARSLGIAVSDATFLYGESRGGIMTFLALRNGLPVRAAATFWRHHRSRGLPRCRRPCCGPWPGDLA